MKLFVAVVILVVIPSVGESQWQKFQEPKSWLTYGTGRADVTEPQDSTQDKQQAPGNVPPLLNTQPQATPGQAGGDQIGKNVDYQRESNEIQRRLNDLTWWLVALGFGQGAIIFLQFLYGARAANAAKKSAEVAGAALELVDRASLSAENWRFDRSPSGTTRGLACTLRNTGGTPATLIRESVNFIKDSELPARPDFLSLPLTREGPFTVPAQGTLDYVFSFSRKDWAASHPDYRKREMRYLYGYITYCDEFKGLHHLMFFISADFNEQITVVPEPGYNYVATEKKKTKKQTWYNSLFNRNP